MDILAHGLWAGAAGKAVNKYSKNKKLNIGWTAFWGVFPDLFAFTIPFVWVVSNLIIGRIGFEHLPPPDSYEPDGHFHFFGNGRLNEANFIFRLTAELYHFSHSIIIFSFILGLVILIYRWRSRYWKIPWEMGGWLLHILIDIPTHTYRFFPTPVFWPIWGWQFDGFSWATPWFLIVNYSAIVIVYFYLWKKAPAKSPQ